MIQCQMDKCRYCEENICRCPEVKISETGQCVCYDPRPSADPDRYPDYDERFRLPPLRL